MDIHPRLELSKLYTCSQFLESLKLDWLLHPYAWHCPSPVCSTIPISDSEIVLYKFHGDVIIYVDSFQRVIHGNAFIHGIYADNCLIDLVELNINQAIPLPHIDYKIRRLYACSTVSVIMVT